MIKMAPGYRKFFLIGSYLVLPIFALCQDLDVKVNINNPIRLNQVGNIVQSNLTDLLSGINRACNQKTGAINLDMVYLDQKAKSDLEKLWANSPFYCVENKIRKTLLEKSDGEFQVRQILIKLSNPDESEELVVNFSNDGMINNISFAIKEQQYLGLLTEINKNDRTDVLNRELILDFIENFRTAYNKKDIEFLQKVYSNDAFIIVGKVINKSEQGLYPADQYYKSLGKKSIEYVQYTKEQYLKRLSEVFQKERSISVDFSDIKIARHLKYPDFYGVYLKQVWKSSYEDEGYLFLLMQFRTNDNPLIWVRTWQDVKETIEDEVFGLHNFVIN